MRFASLLTILLLTLSPLLIGQSYTTSSYADHVVLADFNRDGYPDMAIVTEEPAVDIFFNDHHGGFGSYTDIPSQATHLCLRSISMAMDGPIW